MPEPSRIPQAWAADGDYNVIPATDAGTGLSSWEEGFPPETQTPITAGGVPPRRQDMNGALNAVSKELLWYQQGGLWTYNAQTNYEVGNEVLQNGSLYYCIRANGPGSTVKSPANDTAETYWKPIIFSNGRHPDPDHLLAPAVLQVLQAVYPIGSIYCSYGNTSPDVLFGFGTWAKIEGRFLLGANATYGLGSTGGAATVTLTVNQIPAHNHSASSASAGAHTHGITVNSAGAHTHTASSASNGAHTHTVSGTAAESGAHEHDVSGTAASAGAHTHTITVNSGGSHTHTASSASNGAHTHDITVAASGKHTHTASSASAGAHTHSITVNSGGSHTHTASSASAGTHTHTASSNQTGAHTHTRGTMNITASGFMGDAAGYSSGNYYEFARQATGALYYTGTQNYGSNGGIDKDNYLGYFDASRSWSGSTSSAGEHSHTITVNSAGSHSHDITVNNGGVHNHTATSASNGAHTHTITVTEGGEHTHSATSKSAGAHTHTITVNSGGSHTHGASSASNGAHTHTVSGTAVEAGKHTHTVGGTAASAGAHSHSITVNSNGAHVHTASSASAGAHTHGITVSNTGGSQSHNNLPPYMAVNIWRRTA